MELFSWQMLATVAGGALATALVANGLAATLGWDARWIGLLVALVISVLATGFTVGWTAEALGLALVNGFMIYAAATGGNAVMAGRQRPAIRMVGERPFWYPWW